MNVLDAPLGEEGVHLGHGGGDVDEAEAGHRAP